MSELPSYLKDCLQRQKYRIEKTNGNPVDPDARYFVLRYDKDPHATRAMIAYAKSLIGENSRFTKDLLTTLFIHVQRHNLLQRQVCVKEWAEAAYKLLYRCSAEQEALEMERANNEIAARLSPDEADDDAARHRDVSDHIV